MDFSDEIARGAFAGRTAANRAEESGLNPSHKYRCANQFRKNVGAILEIDLSFR